jgi:hypothetical protein
MKMDEIKELTKNKKEYKLSEESAKTELQKLIDHYECDFELIPQGAEEAVEQIFNQLLSAIRQGKLEIDDKDADKGLTVIQHLKNGDSLTYRELRGGDKAKLSDNLDSQKRLYTLAGILCGLGIDCVLKLPAVDLKVVDAISGFFIVCC